MVTAADIRIITERWKKAILEDYDGQEDMRFDDPKELAAFIILMRVLKEQDTKKRMCR